MQFAPVVELEIFLLEVGNDFALRVADHDANQHIVDADLESGGCVAAGNFLRVAGVGRLGRRRGLAGLSSLVRRRSGRRLRGEAVRESELAAEEYRQDKVA